MERTCAICKETLPLEAFYKSPKKAMGRGYYCKPCKNAKERRTRSIRLRSEETGNVEMLIPREDYNRMSEAQKGLCAICGKAPTAKSLAVDHCHVTGKIRGLLCCPCNRAIGLMRDDPARLLAAAAYVSRNSPAPIFMRGW